MSHPPSFKPFKSLVGLEARAFGIAMEDEALRWFLTQVGGRCISRRDQWKGGELDLVFEVPGPRGTELVFVEVKARSGNSYGGAVGGLGPKKLARVSRSVSRFLSRYHGEARSVRFDLLAWEGDSWKHWPNLWPLPGG